MCWKQEAIYMSQKSVRLLLVYLTVLILILTSCGKPVTPSAARSSGASISSPAPAPTSPVSSITVKPQGELTAALVDFGNENFLPWKAALGASQICCLVYDMLIYYDEVNQKFIPGLAENWEVSTDAKTLTYHIRKGIQYQDGWGELTAEDVKYNIEKQAGKDSVGKVEKARSIDSMDIPDPYTLVLHFRAPQPTFFAELSLGGGGSSQGIVSRKFVETVGEDIASRKPIGSGPYKLLESLVGSYYKLEAVENHWRVVPEFKDITLRAVPEISTTVAMLKNKEIDLASVPSEQLAGLKAVGLATEMAPAGGAVFVVALGGLYIPADFRYKADMHNKDPWVDKKVRQAMSIAIDRQAICKAIYAGAATPAGAVIPAPGIQKYQYSYNPALAKQLLKEAGYPNGFSFKAMSYTIPGIPETPRVMEALCGYWQQIGLDPKISAIEYSAFKASQQQAKTAGGVSILRISPGADLLDRAALFIMPGGMAAGYEDEGSYAIFKEGSAKVNAEERAAYVEKLNQYYYENYGPIPVIYNSSTWAWNSDKISPFPHNATLYPLYLEYVRHAQPLNTFRLFTPWPGR
jgi:peptide/nickel transport system substrate-binding protein